MTAAINRSSHSRAAAGASEDALLDYIGQLANNRKSARAIRIRLSLLAEHNRRDSHIRSAIDAFGPLMRTFEGGVFPIGDSDIIVILFGANVLKIDQAVQKVRFLFGEDVLFAADPAEGALKFCTWYDLETEFDAFRRDADNCVKTHKVRKATGSRRKAVPAPAAAPPPAATPVSGTPDRMTFAEYGNVETMLNIVDLTPMIRRQPICAVTRDDVPQRVFDEVYVSIGELQKTLAAGKSLAEDRGMFQRLTQTLDRRMLKAVTGGGEGAAGGCLSLNLNVATLLSPEFGRFDADLRAAARGTVMIELNLLDIFSDIGNYVYARDLVQERGYRVCIDGLTHHTATFVERERLGADMVKIYWSPDIAGDPAGNQARTLGAAVRDAGPARVVLCRCDDVTAVRTGLSLGISMFQGHQIDRMLKNGTAIANAA
ncbi:MAG: hypothetical protein VW644_12225 [Alphaproteobacteria bacterium]